MSESLSPTSLVQTIGNAIGTLQGFIALLKPEVLPVLTYRAAVEYFVTERPAINAVESGALVREPHPEGHLITQVFLDGRRELCCKKKGGAPYGRRLIVKALDAELEGLFANQNLVIFS